jgi:tetratricopeptide (TPR) repeat protein
MVPLAFTRLFNPLFKTLMKKFLLVSLFICYGLIPCFSQNILKTKEDTAFVMARTYYPQMQIKMSISFLNSDFVPGPKFSFGRNAEDSIKSLIKKEPLISDHFLALGDYYSRMHRQKQADSLYKITKDLCMNQMMLNPADTHAIRLMAGIFLGEGNFDLAEAYYQEFAKIAPSASAGWSGLALINMQKYEIDKAKTYIQKSIDTDPDNIDNYCQMANLMMLKAIFDMNSYDSITLDTLSYKSYVDTRFINTALKTLPGNPSLLAMKDALDLTGIIYQAFIDNSESLEGHGDSIRFHLRPVSAQAIEGIMSRMQALTNGVFKDKEFPYACLILAAFLKNDVPAAEEWFNKGIRYNPASQNLYENITGVCALNKVKENAYRHQLKLDSIHPVVNNFLMTAYFYFLDSRFDESKMWTEKVLQLEPGNFYANLGMATIYAHKFDFSAAARYLDKAAAVQKTDNDVQMLTAILYLFDQSPMMAKSVLQALQPSYPGPEVDEMLERFFKL